MRVLLISANTEQINMPTLPLGLASVAMATQNAGNDIKMVDLMMAKNTKTVIEGAIKGFCPHLIGISVRNIDDQNMETPKFLLEQVKGVVTDCRSLSNAPIVLGGAGYSMFPASALHYLGADMGIQGEGEIALPALVDRLEQGSDLSGLPGLYLPSGELQGERIFAKDLNVLPFPDLPLLSPSAPQGQEFWLPFQMRRGCPMNCSYCSTATIEGKQIRKYSPEVVVEGISRWIEAGFHSFYFVDNTFNIPSFYAKEICQRLISSGLKISWRCILYPGKMDEGLIEDMARGGCREVSVGFESGCDRILEKMNKKFSSEDVRLTCQMLADQGIRRMGFLLLGGPGETRKSAEESLAFADSLNLEALKLTVGVRIYPYTFLAKIAVDEGIIAVDDDLLFPRFYMVRELEGWLHETVRNWMAERPHWVT
jgi:radical SAM superfamily enzyme YgiQ (UPF0313 family)